MKECPKARQVNCQNTGDLGSIQSLWYNDNIVETSSDQAEKIADDAEGLTCEAQTEEEKKEMLIGAHEDLVKIDETNLAKFQDLLTFLKNEE